MATPQERLKAKNISLDDLAGAIEKFAALASIIKTFITFFRKSQQPAAVKAVKVKVKK
jgi:hypothetical protein